MKRTVKRRPRMKPILPLNKRLTKAQMARRKGKFKVSNISDRKFHNRLVYRETMEGEP